ncbi:MAG: hypothetical protein JRJ58_24410 [Deltaproteobacteria bacterium]|nr:hypothetical protein [Deltaproteobacteria bacterium]
MRIDASPLFCLAAVAICLVLVAGAAMAGPFDDPGHLPGEMTAWATSVDDFMAGPVDIAQPGLGFANFGLPALVLGPSQTNGGTEPGDVVSLGDGGFITLHFDGGIGDGIGNDFAVFENGFVDQGSGFFFGEFAFVEVSTNGLDQRPRLCALPPDQSPGESGRGLRGRRPDRLPQPRGRPVDRLRDRIRSRRPL